MVFTVFHHRKSLIFYLMIGRRMGFWLSGFFRPNKKHLYQAGQHFRSGNRTRLPFNPTPRNPDHPMEDKYSYPWNISYPDVLFPLATSGKVIYVVEAA
jgi:hypothetical protein